jgi:hypothetical protein
MLNRSISRDRDLSDLINETDSDVGLLFTWMIPHLDRDGRIDADPEVVKGLIVPRLRRIDAAKVAELLRILAAKNLVEIYEDDRGLRFLSFPGFKKNQAGMRYDREAASEFPTPEECRQVSGPTPESIRTNSGPAPAEWNGMEENRMEGEEEAGGGSAGSGSLQDSVRPVPLNDKPRHWKRGDQIEVPGDFAALSAQAGGPVGAGLTGKARGLATKILRGGKVDSWEYEEALEELGGQEARLNAGLIAAVVLRRRQESSEAASGDAPRSGAPRPQRRRGPPTDEELLASTADDDDYDPVLDPNSDCYQPERDPKNPAYRKRVFT